jgi:type III secretory pathway component EscV
LYNVQQKPCLKLKGGYTVKWLAIIGAAVVILIIGGGLTSQLISEGAGGVLPGVIKQVESPNASVMVVEGWKAEQLFLLIGFILFNLVGIAVTLAIIMWFLNRQVKEAKAAAASGGAAPAKARAEQTEAAEGA